MNMDKLSMDVPEEREALKEAFDQIIDTIVKNGGQILPFSLKEASLEEILFQVVKEGV